MFRVFTRDVGSYKVGDIPGELNWEAFAESAARFHGIAGGADSFSMPVDEAARRYALERAGGRRAGKPA
jgi:hypothetical protein